jgi:hypothetical protein
MDEPRDTLDTVAPVELQFRDGKRWVPAHLADMMGDLETYKMTYAAAEAEANQKLTRDFINDRFDAIVQRHFRRY